MLTPPAADDSPACGGYEAARRTRMYHHKITDWDNAYTNGANIPGGERWPDAWAAPAKPAPPRNVWSPVSPRAPTPIVLADCSHHDLRIS